MYPKETIQFWLDELEYNQRFPNPYVVGKMQTVDMNIFTACEIFFTFLESKPCHQR